MIERTEALGFRINHVYGLTETYGPITICEWQPRVGRASASSERARLKARQGVHMVTADAVRVVDAEMNDVPADGETMGEVVMRGNNVMKGYFADEAATAEAFRGGWFHSGDLGVMHPDGYIELRDRAKDIIISGGENISTIEVEQALVRHPDVLEAAVIAIPTRSGASGRRRSSRCAPGASLTAEELIAFSRETLPGLQGAGRDRVRRAAEDLDRQGQEVRAARPGARAPGRLRAAAGEQVGRPALVLPDQARHLGDRDEFPAAVAQVEDVRVVLREHGRQLADPAGQLEQLRVQLEDERDAGREHALAAGQDLDLVALGVDEEEVHLFLDDVVEARDLDLLAARGVEARLARAGRDVDAHRPGLVREREPERPHDILGVVQRQVRAQQPERLRHRLDRDHPLEPRAQSGERRCADVRADVHERPAPHVGQQLERPQQHRALLVLLAPDEELSERRIVGRDDEQQPLSLGDDVGDEVGRELEEALARRAELVDAHRAIAAR